jgi:hypothetical protein
VTSQIPDTIVFEDSRYVLAGLHGGSLFKPADYEIEPEAMSSACWRGYFCAYDTGRYRLVLTGLCIGARSKVFGSEITPHTQVFGRTPEVGTDYAYRDIDLAIPFTGSLLLGQGFIDALYVHMGFQPAWKFSRVIELHLESGIVSRHLDRSEAAQEVRDAVESGDTNDPERSSESLDWIKEMYTLDGRRSLGF